MSKRFLLTLGLLLIFSLLIAEPVIIPTTSEEALANEQIIAKEKAKMKAAPSIPTNVKITYAPTPRNPTDLTFLVENFELPWVGSPPAPPGWTQTRIVRRGDGIPEGPTVNGEKDWERVYWDPVDNRWEFDDGTSANIGSLIPTGPPPQGTGALYMNDYYFGPTASAFGSRRLESPTMNLTGSTSPYVRFLLYCGASSGVQDLKVAASSDGGATWQNIMIIPSNAGVNAAMTPTTPWQQINVAIPPAFRTANAKIGLEYVNRWGVFNYWIDSLVVEDFTPTLITAAVSGNWSAPATWIGGVVPNANNDVFVPPGITVSVDVNIARMQNLTVGGTFTFLNPAPTGVTPAVHVFGDLLVNPGGLYQNHQAGSTTARTTWLGGNLTNMGTIDFSVATTGNVLWFCGGAPATFSNTGVITNARINQVYFANSGGVTIGSPLTIAMPSAGATICHLVNGPVNPAGNLTIGSSAVQTSQVVGRGVGSFTAAPIWGAGVTTIGVSYSQYFAQPMAAVTRLTGFEIQDIGGVRTVTGTLTMACDDNVQLTYPLTVGTATTGGLTLTRGILITSFDNLLTLSPFIAGPIGTAPSTATPPTTHGSYIAGPMRINFPTTGTTARNFALGVGTAFNGPVPNANVRKYLTLSPGTTAWAGQTILASIEPAPSGIANPPLFMVMGTRAYRLNLLGGPDLPATATLTIRGMNYTFGDGSGTDNLVGTQAGLRVVQSPALTGPWTERSVTTGGDVPFVDNTEYPRTTATAAPGPIAPLAVNGEYFAFGTTTVMPGNDMGVSALLATLTPPFFVGDEDTFRVRVNNYGVISQTGVYVVLDANGTRVDSVAVTVPMMATRDTILRWTPIATGPHTLKFFTKLAGDENPANDTLTITRTVCPEYWAAPFYKDFDEAWGPYANNPPECGWRIAWDGTPEANDWYRKTSGWPGHGSAAFAAVDWYPSENPSYDSLISPRFNLTGLTNIVLRCSTYWDPYGTAYNGALIGSTDNGETWPYTIQTYTLGSGIINAYETFNLPWAADKANVRFCWVGVGNTFDLDYWYVDDVSLTGEAIVNDVGTELILNPTSGGTLAPGATLTPQARIRNYGNWPNATPVRFTIAGPTPYSDLQTTPVIPVDGFFNQSFTPTPALAAGYYTMKCSTALVGDANPGNDFQTGNFLVMAAPNLTAPAHLSIVNNLQPLFDWDDLEGALSYELQLDTLASFATAIVAFPLVSTWTPPAPLTDNKHYYWRVRGVNVLNGPWSAVFEFDLDATAPGAPTLVYPTPNQAGVDTIPNFDWDPVPPLKLGTKIELPKLDAAVAAKGNLGNDLNINHNLELGNLNETSETPSVSPLDAVAIDYYTLQLDTLDDFSSSPLLINATITSPTTELLSPITLETGTRYYWRVNATDLATNTGPWSTDSFTTLTVQRPTGGWVAMTPVPTANSNKNPKSGSCMAGNTNTGKIYFLKASNTNDFHIYTPDAGLGAWTTESMPLGVKPTNGKKPKKGAAIASYGDNLYVLRGNNTQGFWKYTTTTSAWDTLAPIPTGISGKKPKDGTGMVKVTHNGRERLFVMKGAKTDEFYLYDIADNKWLTDSIPAPPEGTKKGYKKGSCLAYDGANTVYVLKGQYGDFFKYNLATSSWDSLTRYDYKTMLNRDGKKKKIGEGSGLVMYGDNLYLLKGGNTLEMWKYGPLSGTAAWSQLDTLWDIPLGPAGKKKVKGGGALLNFGGYFWASKGNNTSEFYRHDLPSDFAIVSNPTVENEGAMAKNLTTTNFNLTIAPNPAINLTAVRYSLPSARPVSFKLYNVTGAIVKTYANTTPTKDGVLMLDTKALPSGVYILRFNSGDIRVTRKIVLEK